MIEPSRLCRDASHSTDQRNVDRRVAIYRRRLPLVRLEAPSPTGSRTTPNASAPPTATADQSRKQAQPFHAIVIEEEAKASHSRRGCKRFSCCISVHSMRGLCMAYVGELYVCLAHANHGTRYRKFAANSDEQIKDDAQSAVTDLSYCG